MSSRNLSIPVDLKHVMFQDGEAPKIGVTFANPMGGESMDVIVSADPKVAAKADELAELIASTYGLTRNAKATRDAERAESDRLTLVAEVASGVLGG